MTQDPMMIRVLKQFRVLLRSVGTHYRQVERRSGLGGAQLWALAEIARNRGLAMGELAAKLGIHLSTASNLVKRLEELGLVTRGRAAGDQRVVHITATAAGRRKLQSAPKPSAGLLQQALMEMTPAEIRALNVQLGKLLRNMDHIDRAAATKLIPDILHEHDSGR